MVQTKTGGRGVCSQDGGLLISYLMADIALVILLMQIQIDLEVRLTPAPRDNDEEALLTFIEDQFVFDQVQKTDHTNQREEELAEDEFIAKVFLNSIIVEKNNSIYVSTVSLFCFSIFAFPINPQIFC